MWTWKSGWMGKFAGGWIEECVCKCECGVEIEEAHLKLASMYWTAKMHYDPPRSRFIASSSKCVTKSLSQLISKCLKLVQKEHKKKCARENSFFKKVLGG